MVHMHAASLCTLMDTVILHSFTYAASENMVNGEVRSAKYRYITDFNYYSNGRFSIATFTVLFLATVPKCDNAAKVVS